MKIAGIDPKSLCNEVLLVLPRGESELVFRAKGLPNMDEFEALCPKPNPPGKMTRDGWVPMPEDPTYQQLISAWGQTRLGYMIVKSLEPSQIEWDTVNLADPSTWKNWSADLRGGGLSDIECQRVMNIVLEANCLDEAKLKKAREVFLRGQELKATSSGLPTAPQSTPSGEPASA
jgi:hypothetical protein